MREKVLGLWRGASPRWVLVPVLLLVAAALSQPLGGGWVGGSRGVLGLSALGALGWLGRRSLKGSTRKEWEGLKLLSRVSLTPRSGVALLEAGEQRFLVAFCDSSVELRAAPFLREGHLLGETRVAASLVRSGTVPKARA